MSAPTVQKVRDYYGGLSQLSDAQVTQYISDAVAQAELDGMADTAHASYNLLIRLRVGQDLQSHGLVSTVAGPVTHQRVADVEQDFSTGSNGAGGGPSNYADSYRQLLLNILGMTSRIGRVS